ncbi:MAG: DedA family protein [Bacteroidota bacterium]
MAGWEAYGYWGLFAASFLAATVVPLSSEALLALLLQPPFDPVRSLVIATAGNWLGGLSTYYLGYLGKWSWIERWLRIPKARIGRWKQRLDRSGTYFAVLCWTPFIGDVIAVGLGVIRSRPLAVAWWMLVGKAGRYLLLAYLLLN